MTATSAAPAQTHCPYCALQCGMALTPAGSRSRPPTGVRPCP